MTQPNVIPPWQVVLATDEPQSHISDVFIFAQDQDQIEINHLAEGNMLDNEDFREQMPDTHEGKDISLKFVNEVLSSIKSEKRMRRTIV